MRTRREDSFNFWPVYSDLALSMILILLLFLLSQFIFNVRLVVERDAERARVEQRQALVREQLENLAGVTSIQENGNLQIITLSADVLFRSDNAELHAEGLQTVERIGTVLLAQEEHFTRLAVEGHADFQSSLRYSQEDDHPDDGGNWRLAAERSIRVVQHLQALGFDGERLEVVSRSKYQPVDLGYESADTTTVAGRRNFYAALRSNRRLVLRVFYSEVDGS